MQLQCQPLPKDDERDSAAFQGMNWARSKAGVHTYELASVDTEVRILPLRRAR